MSDNRKVVWLSFRKGRTNERMAISQTVPTTWAGRSVEAADPPPIADAPVELSIVTARRTEQATAAVAASGARLAAPFEVAGRLLLRAEGVASSAIEGVRAAAADVAMAEAGVDDVSHVASWVADNLAVVTDALRAPGPITIDDLFDWHRRLMRHAPGIEARHVGAWRDTLGWVGGANPLVAAHVAVPPARIGPLMDDLMAFSHRRDVDPITQAAVAHAQFETIHPFADGNGRIGRVLIGWVLSARVGVAYPPPVSLELARDVGGYLSGLALFRQGHVDAWVQWFADTVVAAAARVGLVLDALAELQRQWAAATGRLRSDSAARRLVPLLPANPVLSVPSVAVLLGVSRPAARSALEALERAGVVVETEPVALGLGRPRRWWVAEEMLALIGR